MTEQPFLSNDKRSTVKSKNGLYNLIFEFIWNRFVFYPQVLWCLWSSWSFWSGWSASVPTRGDRHRRRRSWEQQLSRMDHRWGTWGCVRGVGNVAWVRKSRNWAERIAGEGYKVAWDIYYNFRLTSDFIKIKNKTWIFQFQCQTKQDKKAD